MDALLKQIMAACKGGAWLVYNLHITTGIKIEDYLYELAADNDDEPPVAEPTRDMIVKLNTIFVITMYVDPPVNGNVNYYRAIHYNYEEVLEIAIGVLKTLGKL